MYNMSENNERNGRRSALLLAILLHLVFFAVIYFGAPGKTHKSTLAAEPEKMEKSQPAAKAKPRVVKLP